MYRLRTLLTSVHKPCLAVWDGRVCQPASRVLGLLAPGSVAATTAGTRPYASGVAAEPFLSGTSSSYVEDMFLAWQQDPNSVHKVSMTSGGILFGYFGFSRK